MIDSHLHLWDPARFRYPWLTGPLERAFLPRDLDLGASGVTGAVLVQAETVPEQGLDEARWLAGLQCSAPRVFGVVGRARVEQGEGVRHDLEALRALPAVVGVRRNLQDEPDDLVRSPGVVAGLRAVAEAGLVFDACIRWWQLPLLTELVRQVPDLAVVLDHCGKPPLRDGAASEAGRRWAAELRRLAALPNVAVKLSGLPFEAPADVELGAVARPFLEETLDAFGPERAMAGSDWPVSATVPRPLPYDAWFALLLAGASTLERAAIGEATARRVYRLPEAG